MKTPNLLISSKDVEDIKGSVPWSVIRLWVLTPIGDFDSHAHARADSIASVPAKRATARLAREPDCSFKISFLLLFIPRVSGRLSVYF